MLKSDAIKFFGSCSALARELRLTPHAVIKWPDTLSNAQEDRVLAAWARRHAVNIPKEFQR